MSNYVVNLGLNPSQFIAGTTASANAIDNLAQSSTAANQNIQNTFNNTATTAANAASSINRSAATVNQSMNTLNRGVGQAGFVVTDFNRIIQDLPFGFVAISNNLGPVFDSFGL